MKRHQYTALTSNEPQPLTKENAAKVDKFLWGNFWENLKEQPSAEIQTLMKKYILDVILFQDADFEARPKKIKTNEQLFRTMKDPEIQIMATHLYVSIQLIGSINELYTKAENKGEEYATSIYKFKLPGFDAPAFSKYPHPIPHALEQANPYLLRIHVYHLFQRMHNLMMSPDKNTADCIARRKAITEEAERTLKKLPALVEMKFPALAHLLSAYGHATIAAGSTDPLKAREQWERVYTQILWTEKEEESHADHMFLVNRGQDFYQCLPHKSFADFKSQVAGILGHDVTEQLRKNLDARLKPK